VQPAEKTNRPRIAIVGASARAAAASAIRAALLPWCADLFGDADLAAMCPVNACEHYPHDLPKLILDAPSSPWMYTGAVDNYPEIVARIAKHRPLWGVDAPTLERVRDPWQVAEALHRQGLPFPDLARSPEQLPNDGAWLTKQFRSAGGQHISPWRGQDEKTGSATRYFQRRVSGADCSAVFVGAAGCARLLGVTRQLIGEPWTGAQGFRYAGSIGPLQLPSSSRDQLLAIGDVLGAEFRLTGLFGIDFILADTQVWPVEVNPRYTASVEILERATGLRSIYWHAAACRDAVLPENVAITLTAKRLHGKAILFARDHVDASPETTALLLAGNQHSEWPTVADIPRAGSHIEPGWPIATVFADGDTGAAVVKGLQYQVAQLQQLLRDSEPAR
jgi:predicted ATP-grasp superfamily ATP-dependent carboligase